MKHPGEIHSDEDMLKGSSPSALAKNSHQSNLSCIIAAATQITPLARLFNRENKREYPEAMDVEERETTRIPKKKKIEELYKLMQNSWAKGRNKMVKVKGPSFVIQEYAFSSVPKEAVRRYKYKSKLLDKYREVGKKDFEERSRLCEEVDKLPSQKMSLAMVRDLNKATLNLAIIT